MKHGVSSMTKSCQKIVSEFKEKCIVVRMFGYVLSNIYYQVHKYLQK
jgi:hypothetical protein